MTDIRARWTGESFYPVNTAGRRWCVDQLKLGEIVAFEIQRDRNMASHRHYFAAINQAWANLPEWVLDAPYAKSAETMRRHALIVGGFADAEVVDAGAPAVAERIASMMKRDGDKVAGYCIVQVRGQVVTRFTAQSQSVKAMGRDEFERSKRSVLDWCSAQIAVNLADLSDAAERGAA